MIKFADMFSGIGGFRLGLEKASEKYKCVWSCDNDKYVCQVYRRNFGDGELVEGDIRTIDADEIPDHELLTAGFPCQSFSVAGKRKGFQDTRGTLFYDILRVTDAKRPPILLLENVKGLLSHDQGATFQVVLESLGELGYWCEWQVLNSKHFGVPQNRERVFIIGHLGEKGGREVFPIGEGGRGDFKNIEQRKIEYAHKADRELSRIYKIGGIAPTLHGKTGGWQEPKILDRHDEMAIQLVGDRDNPSISLKDETFCLSSNPMSDRQQAIIQNFRIRRLTPTECERLQGFPDGWTERGLDEKGNVVEISDTQRYKMLGNAVTVPVIEFLGRRILERCFP
jgi:DNA (cytosine-5)-methyltransferase 1